VRNAPAYLGIPQSPCGGYLGNAVGLLKNTAKLCRGTGHAKDIERHVPDEPHTTMSKIKTTRDLLVHSLKDLYSAETQLVKALPKMAKAATNPDLKEGFTNHLEETKGHVERLQQVADILEVTPRGLTCKAMKGLIEESAETIEEDAEPTLKDLALITAAQKVEHYEISGYGSIRALSTALGLTEITALFEATEQEEGNADKTLGTVAAQLLEQALAEEPAESQA
jgi:ferritin-like metal-binding protein YciE